jgi:hypothetical protein
VVTFTAGYNLNCKERLVIESSVFGIDGTATSSTNNVNFTNTFSTVPGVFGQVMTVHTIQDAGCER